MILAILLVIAAALSLVFIVGVAVSRHLQFSKRSPGELQLVNLEAFRNLVDPRESDYLERHLQPSEFRRIQRLRLRATAAYIGTAASNAARLIQIGQMALASGDPQTRESARQLVDDALLLRRNAAFALLRIYLALAWPKSAFTAAPILEGYQRLSGSAMLLGRLQDPAASVRLSA